jgi:hypothetical protein
MHTIAELFLAAIEIHIKIILYGVGVFVSNLEMADSKYRLLADAVNST